MCKLYKTYTKIFCAAMVALVCAAPAFAATQVAGAITQNTAWTVAGSPYVLSGDVTIENGASVSVEPGVRILMNAGANLRVVAGALSAQGTSAAPIDLTSAQDAAGAGATAQPGDWGRLVFEDGTNDANTVLSHVRIRYGSGVAINAASPRIDDTEVSHHAAAAIAVDLASSPVGRGLSASGNAINGIAVPAGVIVGDVAWRLQGIPYVVAQGAVEIGLPPFSLTPEVLQLVAGSSGELQIHLPEPAPAGGVSVALSAGSNGVASVVSPVVVPAGAHTATATVTANRVGEVDVTATNGSSTSAQSRIVVAAQPSLSLSAPPGSVGVGRNKTVTVSRNATGGAIVVDLVSTDPAVLSVPANVALAAGQASASFDVSGVAQGSAVLRANASGHDSASVQQYVHNLAIVAPSDPLVAALSSVTFTVQLSDPAPSGGLTVAVANADASALEAPASVAVPAGATTFELTARSLKNRAQWIDLDLSTPGYAAATTTVRVYRYEPQLNLSSLPVGANQPVHVTLNAAAPPGGLTVSLSSLVPGVIDIAPDEVTIAAGAMQSMVPAVVTARRAGRSVIRLRGVNIVQVEQLQEFVVTEPMRLDLSTAPIRLGKGLAVPYAADIVDANGQRANPGFPVIYQPVSGDPAKVGVPGEPQTWWHNQAGSAFAIGGIDTTGAPVTVTLRNTQPDNGIGDAPAVPVEVVVPQLSFYGLGSAAEPAGVRRNFSLNWTPHGELPQSAAPLRISIVDANPPGVVAGLYDSADAQTPVGETRHSTVWYDTAAVGSFRVKVELVGVGTWTSPLQTVAATSLRFEDAAFSLGLGLEVGSLSVSTYVGEEPGSAALPSDFAIVSADPSKVEVVEVRKQWSGAYVTLRALAATLPNQPVVVRATGTGHVTAETAVTVVPAALEFVNLDAVRSAASDKDTFTLRWAGKHAPSAAQPVDVTVSLASSATPGVLPDPAVTRQGGAVPAVTQIVNGSNTANASLDVAVPSGQGTYRLNASTPGGATALSDVQSVGPGLLRLGPTSFRTRGIFPIGKRLTDKARVALVDGSGNEIAATIATTVSLVSRAPGWVSVPASVVIAAGQSSAEFDVTGVEVTDGDVLVDAYVDGVDVPAATLPVGVFPLDVAFDLDTVRLLDDPPSPFGARLQFYYPCSDEVLAAKGEPPEGDHYCPASAPLAQAQVATLAIVGDGSPPIVSGFLTVPGGAPTTTQNFPAGGTVGENLAVGTPTRSGSYRVRLTLDGRSFESEPVTVGTLRIAPGRAALTVGAGTVDEYGVQLDLLIGDAIAAMPSTPIVLQVACADASVCSTPASIEMDSNTVAVPVTGIGVGTTTLTLSAPGLPAIAPVAVTVVKPVLAIEAYPIDSGLAVGATAQVWAELIVPGASWLKTTQPIVVDVANVAAAAASAPATLTIPAGEYRSAPGEIRALSPGRTALLGSAPGIAGASSKVVVVKEAGE